MDNFRLNDIYYRTRTAELLPFPETSLSRDNLFYNINLNWRDKMKCQICNKSFKTMMWLSRHLSQNHYSISHETYYQDFMSENNNEILCNRNDCNKKAQFKNIGSGYKQYCSIKCRGIDKRNLNKRKWTSLSGIENNDYVKCQICDGKLRQIHFRHLDTHNIIFQEYKNKFPNTPTVCSDYSKLTANGNSNREITEETCRKISISNTGKLKGPKSVEAIQNQRNALLKFYQTDEGKINRLNKREVAIERIGLTGTSVNFNKTACEYFDWLNAINGWNGEHALNGGEKSVAGYFIDYYEPNHNIVIEWDEDNHYFNGELKKKDIERMNEIKDILNCEFYRIREKELILKKY